jgi:outer membrane protein assembly factor BamB
MNLTRPQGLNSLLPMLMRWIPVGIIVGSLLGACADNLPPKEDDAKVIDLDGILSGDEQTPDAEASKDGNIDTPLAECNLEWRFTITQGGNANHPIVDDDGITTITSGSACLRVTSTGSQQCSAPFMANSESGIFGAPSQAVDGTIYIGTAKGDLYAVTDKCTPRWLSPVRVVDKAATDKEPFPIRAAPVINGSDIYLLDERPALHKCLDNKSNGICGNGTDSFHYWVDDEALPNAAPIYSGGAKPFVVFPSKKRVTAVDAAGSRYWDFSEFGAGEEDAREVTSALALNSQRKVLFIAGESMGNGFYKQLQIYRILPESPDLKAVVDLGFPKDIDGLTQDRANALVIGPDNAIYVATNAHGIVRLTPSGDFDWAYLGDAISARVTAAPALGNDGALYFMGEPHYLFGIDKLSRTITFWEDPHGGEMMTTSPAISNTGQVLVHIGTELMAIRCESTGLAVSSWPRYQRNNRSSGNLNEQN